MEIVQIIVNYYVSREMSMRDSETVCQESFPGDISDISKKASPKSFPRHLIRIVSPDFCFKPGHLLVNPDRIGFGSKAVWGSLFPDHFKHGEGLKLRTYILIGISFTGKLKITFSNTLTSLDLLIPRRVEMSRTSTNHYS